MGAAEEVQAINCYVLHSYVTIDNNNVKVKIFNELARSEKEKVSCVFVSGLTLRSVVKENRFCYPETIMHLNPTVWII